MFSTSYPFDTAGNYTFDTDKIEVSGGKAQLKLEDEPGLTFNQPFTSDSGFTYDAAKAEFTGGKVQQIDQRPTDATFGATYTTNINGNWGDGVLAGSGVGGAAVAGGKLDLAHNDVRYVSYDADLNADNQQVGAIKFKVTPNYSGSPAAGNVFLLISKAANDNDNLIQIQHSAAGQLRTSIYNSAGAILLSKNWGVWSPTSGVEYEIELNWNIHASIPGSSEVRMFVDGVQFGTTSTGFTGTRDANIALLRIGSDSTGALKSNFEMDDVVIFSTVQHTGNYTPGYTLQEYDYVGSKVELPQFIYSVCGAIQVFTNFVTTETGSPHYVWDDQYWNGSAWVASNGTYAQGNDKSVILANLATFPVCNTLDIDLIFTGSNSQNDADDLTVTFTGQIYDANNPTIVPNAGINADGLESFLATVTETGSDAVKFVLSIDGVNKYWNGAAWSASTGYAQSNTAAEIETNKAALDISLGVVLKPVTYLHSDAGTTTPDITIITVGYNFYSPPDPSPEKCLVYGYLLDPLGEPIADAKITAILKDNGFIDTKNLLVLNQKLSATTNSLGYWELTLIRTVEYADALLYDFEFRVENSLWNTILDKTIPDESTAAFDDLV